MKRFSIFALIAGCFGFGLNAQHISDFSSLGNTVLYESVDNQDTFLIPSTHAFQFICKVGDALTTSGNKGASSDYTGFVPSADNPLTHGYLCINSEAVDLANVVGLDLPQFVLDIINSALASAGGAGLLEGGGVDIYELSLDTATKRWDIVTSKKADFGTLNPGFSAANCSGSRTPWGTAITCEEFSIISLRDILGAFGGLIPSEIEDRNADGYLDLGWCVEIDPVSGEVMDYDNDGTNDKLWQVGNLSHENVSEPLDQRTVYFGQDNTLSSSAGNNFIYKFVADSAGDLSSGTLYVLVGNTPTNPTSGTWTEIPNKTVADQESINDLPGLSAWNVPRVEDVEINPLNWNEIFVTSTEEDRLYKLTEDSTDETKVTIEVWIDNDDYLVGDGNNDGVEDEVLFSSPDNLCFDDLGNLYIQQDGGISWIYMMHNDHTPANPHLSIFGRVPLDAESTGMTFSADYKYMFLSIQHPSATNTTPQKDVNGVDVVFDDAVTLVIARNEVWNGTDGTTARPEVPQSLEGLVLYPNPAQEEITVSFAGMQAQNGRIEVSNSVGYVVKTFPVEIQNGANSIAVDLNDLPVNLYFLNVRGEDGSVITDRFVKMK